MNEPPPIPNPLPPELAAAHPHVATAAIPIGHDPADKIPVSGMLTAFEAILRHPRRVLFQLREGNARQVILALLIIVFIASVFYGFVVGTFSGHDQLWAAPVKITLGLFVSAAICLPSLYIFSCLSGSQARLVEVFGLVAGLLALMTILLIGFAPVAWIFSQSTNSEVSMGVLHLSFWLIATYFGLRFLNTGFRHFSATFNQGIKIWMLIFLLVAAQMSTALRPILGTAPTFLPAQKHFFIAHWLNCLDDESKQNKTKPGTDWKY